jgi:sortase A
VARRSRTAQQEQEQQQQALLTELLGAPPAEAAPPLRPVVLRTREAQRRSALRSFLQRTWFDRALHIAERLLVVAVLAVFSYWLADGYGRDLWHSWQQPEARAATKATAPPNRPTARPAAHMPAPPPRVEGKQAAAALPFTTPNMQAAPAEPDFLAPRPLAAAPQPSDSRPQQLVVPAIGIDTPVREVFVQDGAWQVADYAAGYHNGSALPGEPGNTVMAGHAGLRGGVFRDLGSLNVGDEAFVVAGGWRYRYRVREVKSVWPDQVEVMDATPTRVLTLITCTAWDTQRLVVVADLQDSLPVAGS